MTKTIQPLLPSRLGDSTLSCLYYLVIKETLQRYPIGDPRARPGPQQGDLWPTEYIYVYSNNLAFTNSGIFVKFNRFQ